MTPHIYAGRWDNSRSFLLPRFEAFKKLVISKEIDIELFLGAEVHLLPESLRLLSEGEIPFIGGWDGMKVMLLEMPDGRIPPNAISAVRYLIREGVLPMIAHPERNKMVMDRAQVLEPFVAEGCLLQLTAASLLGEFGDRARDSAEVILDHGWATVVASDAHNLRHRSTRMKAVYRHLTRHYGKEVADQLTRHSPGRLLEEREKLGLDTVVV